ncbi:MAG: hypothetical protein JRH07_18930 [Deltaproteobacteria bacterium]|nr:hypothetical protein [Deltaproteobacteria bacterium]
MPKVVLAGDPERKEYVLVEVRIGFRTLKALIPIKTFKRYVERYEAVKGEGMSFVR